MKLSVSDLRREYKLMALDESDVLENPVEQFKIWFKQAQESDIIEPNAMYLATAVGGRPSLRTVLLKGIDEKGFRFYTNYESRKGRELQENPYAALCFHWGELERQVRIEGRVEKLPQKITKEYFDSRPFKSRVGALASRQSSVVSSRKELEDTYSALLKKYEDKEVPLPEFWGGYVLIPDVIEFWQGRAGRMHDRIEYSLEKGRWEKKRLSP